jgi:hypothetical protein
VHIFTRKQRYTYLLREKVRLDGRPQMHTFLDNGSFIENVTKNVTSSGYKVLVQARVLCLTHMAKLKKRRKKDKETQHPPQASGNQSEN